MRHKVMRPLLQPNLLSDRITCQGTTLSRAVTARNNNCHPERGPNEHSERGQAKDLRAAGSRQHRWLRELQIPRLALTRLPRRARSHFARDDNSKSFTARLKPRPFKFEPLCGRPSPQAKSRAQRGTSTVANGPRVEGSGVACPPQISNQTAEGAEARRADRS